MRDWLVLGRNVHRRRIVVVDRGCRSSSASSLPLLNLVHDGVLCGDLESGDQRRLSIPIRKEAALHEQLDHKVVAVAVDVGILEASTPQAAGDVPDPVEVIQLTELLLSLFRPYLGNTTSKLLAKQRIEFTLGKLARNLDQVEKVENVTRVFVFDQPCSKELEAHVNM